MKIRIAAVMALTALLPAIHAQTGTKPLTMYFTDMEGGHASLYVSPTGETILIDTGNPGTRDIDRIMAAINDAGVKQIDYLITTHYHVDHIGEMEELSKRLPIKHFIDHGPSVEPREQVQGFQAMYAGLIEKAGKGAHMVAKPGDKIPVTGLNVEVVTSGRQTVKKPLVGPGAGKPNPECASFKEQPDNADKENENSVGVVIAYGKFRTVNLGDFTYDREPELMCPNNPIGTVDLYLTSHHGIDQSGSAVLVHALQPRVVVMHNSTRKGGAVQTYQVIESSPGLEGLWQLHYAYGGGLEHNAPGVYIANIEDAATMAAQILNPPALPAFGPPAGGRGGSGGGGGGGGRGAAFGGSGGRGGGGRGAAGGHTGPAFWIKVTAQPDGAFTVLNSRNNFSKTYAARKN